MSLVRRKQGGVGGNAEDEWMLLRFLVADMAPALAFGIAWVGSPVSRALSRAGNTNCCDYVNAFRARNPAAAD